MSDKTMGEVMEFARRWAGAGGTVVQEWDVWEKHASEFFGDVFPFVTESSMTIMHAFMMLVRSVCFGTPDDVKRAAREITPGALGLAERLLGHLPQFAVVTEAEVRYRAGDLVCDWTLALADGKLVARSEFRPEREPHH